MLIFESDISQNIKSANYVWFLQIRSHIACMHLFAIAIIIFAMPEIQHTPLFGLIQIVMWVIFDMLTWFQLSYGS